VGLVRRLALIATLAVVGSAVAATSLSAAGATQAKASPRSHNLVQFRSCGELLDYLESQASRFVGPWGLGGAAVSVASPTAGVVATPPVADTTAGGPTEGVDYSGTNVQEQGVDEPDLVKTDGTTVFAVANGNLNAVDVRGAKPRLLDSLELGAGRSYELLLYGNRLLVLSRGGYWIQPLPGSIARTTNYVPSQSVLSEVDVSDPKALRVVRTLTLDGSYVAARLVGGSVRIVVSSQVPGPLPFEPPAAVDSSTLAAATERNRAVVAGSTLKSWLPSFKVARPGEPTAADARPLVQCRHVSRPRAFSGLGMTTVLTLDLDKGLDPVDSVAVMTDAGVVYASPRSLYVATERWADRPTSAQLLVPRTGTTTTINRFDISSPQRTIYRGSGAVSGFLLNQWSLSEDRGVLRVVSTDSPSWWGATPDSESFLTTLRPAGGGLVQAARVGDLGKGERVYAVRFVGDVGYVVTFHQVDPLYTLDLADPDHPRVLGELEIEGYSSYLHPIGEDLLLGVGQDASDSGRLAGTQLSIFDVSDLRHPVRLDRKQLGPGWSEAESDHHAFLFWPRTGLVVVPFAQRAQAFRVGRARGIADAGRISQPATQTWAPIRRALVVGGSVVTVSSAGLASNRLDTLADEGWVAFPAPPPPPPIPVPVPVVPVPGG
jgi:uncharacterized secreted protein with C-terminal beta-propeller domain